MRRIQDYLNQEDTMLPELTPQVNEAIEKELQEYENDLKGKIFTDSTNWLK